MESPAIQILKYLIAASRQVSFSHVHAVKYAPARKPRRRAGKAVCSERESGLGLAGNLGIFEAGSVQSAKWLLSPVMGTVGQSKFR